VAKQLGGNAWGAAGVIWYNAVQQLSANSQFQDCGDITAQVAANLYGTNSAEHKAVMDAWTQVGLPTGGTTPAIRRKAGRPKAAESDGNLKRQLERLSQELKKTIEALA
jgi:hypothetical protein